MLLLLVTVVVPLFALAQAVFGEIHGDADESLADILGWPRTLLGCAVIVFGGCFWLSRVSDFGGFAEATQKSGVAIVSTSGLLLPEGATARAREAYAAGPDALAALASQRGWKITVRRKTEEAVSFGESSG